MSVAGAGGARDGGGGRPTGGRRPPSIQGLERFSFVGEGGRAVVWSAWETAFSRQVAVKVLARYDDDDALSRFDRECRAVGRLNHQNIVSVHRTGKTDDTELPFLQMEYLPKGSLADAIRRNGRMPWRDALAIAVKLAGALATAHDRGVLHRDIKPENVLLAPLDEPKLADFGIARVLGQTLSKTAILELTPDHAPPEMARLVMGSADPAEKPTASVQADIYCLASTIFTVLNGGTPFRVEEDNPFALLSRIAIAPVPNLRPLGVPSAVCEVIERGMAKDPRDRQSSALEFGQELQRAQEMLGVPQTPLLFIPADQHDAVVDVEPEPLAGPAFREPPTRRVEPGAHPSPPEPARGRRWPVTSALIAVAVLAIVAAAVVVTRGGGEKPVVDRAGGPTGSDQTTSSAPTTSTALSTTTSMSVPAPSALPASGDLAAGSYITASFLPKVTLTVGAGWRVDDGASAERVVLSRSDPRETVTIMRVQRVYRPDPPLATREDALDAVQDVRDLQDGVAEWLLNHPQRRGPGGIAEARTRSDGRVGKRVDAQFDPYDYDGCETTDNKCVPLFQLYAPDGQTFAFARVPTERVRFDVYDVDTAKVVVATSAPVGRFDAFVANPPFSIDAIQAENRLSALRVESSPNPSRENEPVAVTATVDGPCRTGRVVFSDIPVFGQKKQLGSTGVVDGKATLRERVTFDARGQDRIVAEYDGADCAKSISAPLLHRVN